MCINKAPDSKEKFLGIILFVIDLLYHPLYNHDDNIARIGSYMVDSAHEAMIAEHNTRSYTLALEQQKQIPKKEITYIEAKNETNKLPQN